MCLVQGLCCGKGIQKREEEIESRRERENEREKEGESDWSLQFKKVLSETIASTLSQGFFLDCGISYPLMRDCMVGETMHYDLYYY